MKNATYLILFCCSAISAADQQYPIFEVRNDLAYAEARLGVDYLNQTAKLYKPGVALPSGGEGGKRTTELLLGSAPVVSIEKDYIVLKIPADLKGQVAKGDVIRFETALREVDVKAGEAMTTNRNYIFGAGQLLAGVDQKFRLGELGYQRNLEGAFSLGNLVPEVMSIEFRPLQLSTPGLEKTSLAMFYKFTFVADRWLIFNTGVQFGLDKDGSTGGGLIGIGLAMRKLLRFEINVDWLYKSYTDSYGKLSFFISDATALLLQSGVLSLNGKEARSETNYYPTTSVSTYYVDKYTDLTYFTAGIGFGADRRVRLVLRGGIAGTKLDNVGLIGRGEVGFSF